jgi:hypothetical protein
MLQMHVLFKPVHAEGQVSGKYLLSDLRLDYLAMKKRLAQVDTADSLVKAYLKWFCKDVRAATLNDIVPESASAANDVPPLVPPPSTSAFVAVGKHVVMLKIDLNVPNVNRHIIICLFVFGNLH